MATYTITLSDAEDKRRKAGEDHPGRHYLNPGRAPPCHYALLLPTSQDGARSRDVPYPNREGSALN